MYREGKFYDRIRNKNNPISFKKKKPGCTCFYPDIKNAPLF